MPHWSGKSDEMTHWFFVHLSVKNQGGNQVSSWKIVWSMWRSCQRNANYPPANDFWWGLLLFCLFALFKKFFSKSEDRNQSETNVGKNEKAPIKAKNVLFCNCNVVNVVLYEYVFLPFSTPKSQMEHFFGIWLSQPRVVTDPGFVLLKVLHVRMGSLLHIHHR